MISLTLTPETAGDFTGTNWLNENPKTSCALQLYKALQARSSARQAITELNLIKLNFIEVDASLSCQGIDSLILKGFDGFCGEMQSYKALAFGPPNAFPLKIGFL